IEDDPSGCAERERPLVIVLGHFLELRVLDDLQHPEADREHGENHRDDVLKDSQSNADAAAFFDLSHISIVARLRFTRAGITCSVPAQPGGALFPIAYATGALPRTPARSLVRPTPQRRIRDRPARRRSTAPGSSSAT